jgi:hypothetical protein
MNSSQFSKILFIQALEQSDPQAQHIPYSTRQRATQKAKNLVSQSRLPSPESATQFVTHRAESLWNFLSSSYPRMTESFHGAEANLPSFLVGVPALAVGLFINGLGPSQRVNLLNFPLLLLLLWNIGVYTWTLSLLLLRKDPTGPLLRSVLLGVTKLANMAGKGPWPNPAIALSGSTSREWALQAAERFMNLWWKQAYPLLINRVRHLLHLGAACLALGIILSMYFRGLVLDYQATWESTFLSPAQVHGVLHGLLGPAAWLLNFPFPDVEDIAKLQAPGHGSAATWIHMWALTGLAGIVLPRVLFALVSARLAKKAAETFTLPLADPYYLQLLAPDRGRGIQIEIVPYSYQPSPAASEFLGKCLLDLVGNQATLHWREPLPYGQETLPWLKSDTSHQMVVLLCNLAQTPETEVHGEVFRALQGHAEISQGSHQLLLMLDQEAYRHMPDPERRLDRQKTWQRLADDYHLRIVPFEPNETSRDQLLQMAQTALYPQKAT